MLNFGSLNIDHARCIGSNRGILKRQLLEADVNTKFTQNPEEVNGHTVTIKKLEKQPFSCKTAAFYGCGGRTRTYDLRVMSPTSFQLLYSAIFH